MKAQPKGEQRWFDHADFGSEHDAMMMDLLENWWRMVKPLSVDWPAIIGRLEAEPCLKGYPPVFPDAIAEGWHFEGVDHSGEDLEWDWANGRLRCAKCHGPADTDEYQYGLDAALQIVGMIFSDTDDARREKQLKEAGLEGWPKDKRVPARWDHRPPPGLVREVFRVLGRRGKNLCFKDTNTHFKAVFEIKPRIDSFGSVCRQLNIYRDRADGHLRRTAQVILITGDDRFDDAFEGQGYDVYHPPLENECPAETGSPMLLDDSDIER